MKTYADIASDGGSRIAEQVLEQKAKIEKNLASIRHILAVGSGKGGVGKSTMTMQLSFSLKKKGLNVAVLDADFNGPSLARLSGIKSTLPVPGKRGMSVPKTGDGVGVVTLGTFVAEPEVIDFESVSKGESYVWRATKEFSLFGEILAGTDWGDLDILLIDLPPGVERTSQFADFLRWRSKFVLVTIPSDLSLGVVARTVTSFKENRHNLLGVIENMSGYFCNDCGKVQPLFPSSKKIDLGVRSLGQVPFDPGLAALSDRGAPLTDHSQFSSYKALQEVSENIWNILNGPDLKETGGPI